MSDWNKISVGEKLSWFIRHLSDGLYISHTNLWNLPSDIWAQPSEMSDMSNVFRLHCKIQWFFSQISKGFHEIQWYFHVLETDLNSHDFSRAVGPLFEEKCVLLLFHLSWLKMFCTTQLLWILPEYWGNNLNLNIAFTPEVNSTL